MLENLVAVTHTHTHRCNLIDNKKIEKMRGRCSISHFCAL